MKRFATILTGIVLSLGLFAQNTPLPVVLDIVSIEHDDSGDALQVVNMPKDGVNYYYLHIGRMGIGNRIIQIDIDPVDRLFIPLGNDLTTAIGKLEDLKTLYKEPSGTTRIIEGNFAAIFPDDRLEPIEVTRQQVFLTNQLQFVIQKEDHVRAAYMTRSDFNAILSGVKFYGNLHPKEM